MALASEQFNKSLKEEKTFLYISPTPCWTSFKTTQLNYSNSLSLRGYVVWISFPPK